jgi:glutathione S-transferase
LSKITLVSHNLCPYVQRAAIALTEKDIPFERVYVDLSNKPEWFTKISPLGKVPCLIVERQGREEVLFESAVILEYLEETEGRPLHPSDPLEKARDRGWIEFGSAILNAIARLYNAKEDGELEADAERLGSLFDRLEGELAQHSSGPYFRGERFCLVDAVFGPVFRYLDTFEAQAGLFLLEGRPQVAAWRAALAARPSVVGAVAPDYPERLTAFLKARNSAISRWIESRQAA